MMGDENTRGSMLGRLWAHQRGQGIIEYILIISIVTLGAVVSLGFLSGTIQDSFFSSGNKIANLGEPPSGTVVIGPGPQFEIFSGACTVGQTFVYLRAGDAEDTPVGFLVPPPPAHDDLAGFYSCINIAPGSAPTKFTVGIWDFECTWHGLFFDYTAVEAVFSRHQWTSSAAPGRTFLQGCYNLPDAPANTSQPVISGTAGLGGELVTTDGEWDPEADSYTYAWRRGTVNSLNCASYTGPWTTNNMGGSGNIDDPDWDIPNDTALLGKCAQVGVTAEDQYGSTGTPAPAFSVPYGPILDTTPPGVTSIDLQSGSDTGTSNSDNITNAATLNFTVTFNEAVNNVAVGDFSTTGSASGCTVGAPSGAQPGTTFTVQVTGCGEGTVTLRVNSGSVTDTAGNNGPSSQFSGPQVTIDRTGPQVLSIDLQPGSDTGTSNSDNVTMGLNGGDHDITYTVTFSESIPGGVITTGDFSEGGVCDNTPENVSGSGSTRNVTVECDNGDGTTTLSIVANAATDVAGNGTSALSGPQVTIDTTGYNVTIDLVAASDTGASNTDNITTGIGGSHTLTYSVDFGQTVTGITSGDFSESGPCSSGSIAVSGSGSTRTVTITCGSGTSTLSIDAGAANETDQAGNSNNAADGPDVEVDIDISIDHDQTPTGSTHNGASITFRIEDDQGGATNCSTIQASDFIFKHGTTNGSGGTTFVPTITVTDTGDDCNVQFNTQAPGSGSSTVRTTWIDDVAGTSVSDLAGNTDTTISGLSVTYVRNSGT